MPKLIVAQGPNPGQTIELERDVFVIGREQGCDLVIAEPSVSRRHVRLSQHDGQFIVEDLNSFNGTSVNDLRISAPAALKGGDVLGLGQTIRLRLLLPAPPAAPHEAETLIGQKPLARPGAMPGFSPGGAPGDVQGGAQGAAWGVPQGGAQRAVPGTVALGEGGFPKTVMARDEMAAMPGGGAPGGSTPLLIVTISGGAPQTYPLQISRLTIGRAPDNDIVIPFNIVSGHHAVIERLDGVYYFHVLPNVTNPVYFNGKPLSEAVALKNGSLFRIGGQDPGMMVSLEYRIPGASQIMPQMRFDQKNQVQIGRDPNNDIVLPSPTVSRFHAIIERVGQRYRVRDLGSSNGTYVNDQRITAETWVKAGDSIRAGPYRFVLGQDEISQVGTANGMRVEALGLSK